MQQEHTFVVGEKDFELDGEPFQIRAGSIHFARVHPDQWRDRIRKAKQMGLNTVETYIMWNFHSPQKGTYDWSGWRDLGRFLDLIQEEGMWAIVRPGPYVCAEWDNGGLPTWLTSDPEVELRKENAAYMAAVREYMAQIGAIVAPRMIDAGGPIILMQVENEYGAYGDDKQYLRDLVDLYRDVGITVPLTTVDQPQPKMLENGTLPDLLATGSFGSRVPERLATLREHQSTGPLMCAEFWVGWFDHWADIHHVTSVEDTTRSLRDFLEAGASFTVYMFHGGTSFGMTSGANDKGIYRSTVTSYDYDAPLAEDGTPTEKYWAFRDAIADYHEVPTETPSPRRPAPTPQGALTAWSPLLNVVAHSNAVGPTITGGAPTFEDFGGEDGILLYSTAWQSSEPQVLEMPDLKDRAHVFVDGRPVGAAQRSLHNRKLTIPPVDENITVLVENEGRVNYGPRLGETTGLGPAMLNGQPVDNWETTFIPLDPHLLATNLETIESDQPLPGPLVASGTFETDRPGVDMFLDTEAWGRGYAFLNGFFLGRYSFERPQRTLYVPGPIVKDINTVTIIEMRALSSPAVVFAEQPDLGPTER